MSEKFEEFIEAFELLEDLKKHLEQARNNGASEEEITTIMENAGVKTF